MEGPKGKHSPSILSRIGKDIQVEPSNIVDFDLSLADHNPAGFVGINDDFISSPRLDNLFSSYHGTLIVT